jgi:superfamily II RNA helicase
MKPELEAGLKDYFDRIGKPQEAPFIPDPFQRQALEAISRTDCLVTAPTGAGKTWIAEQVIAAVFESGGRAWYASPLKALTNSKRVEFSAAFGEDNVGILTGDVKENADAPIVVGTTEILRNQLYDVMHRGDDLNCDLVILDEAHFLGDPERGVVWEEIMIYLPTRINLLLLSATVGNAEEIAGWLESIRRKECAVVKEERRPVPLHPLFLHPSGRIMPLLTKKKLYNKVASFLDQGGAFYRRGAALPPFDEIIGVLRRFRLLPAIFFLKSRNECDTAVHLVTTPSRRTERVAFDDDLNGCLAQFPYLKEHKQLEKLRRCRVAAHHGGQLPAWKFVAETMMNKGHLDVVFATSTVAAGVNFPARSVVLFNSDQFNGHEFLPLNATEFHQMTGRAGRRGQDRIGFMVIIPQRYMNVTHVKQLFFQKPERIESRIRNDFSMVLNLLLSHTPDDIRELFTRSLANYQSKRKKDATVQTDLWNDFQRHLHVLKAEGFVDESDRLTFEGSWTSQLRLDQPLLIAECLGNNAFPGDDEALLAAVIAPFVYDRDLDIRLRRREQPKKLVAAFDRVQETIAPLIERLNDRGFSVDPLPFWTSVALYHWARGTQWDLLTKAMKLADGDLTMLISRTADNLNQIASLRDSHREIAACAAAARKAILREPVIFEGI